MKGSTGNGWWFQALPVQVAHGVKSSDPITCMHTPASSRSPAVTRATLPATVALSQHSPNASSPRAYVAPLRQTCLSGLLLSTVPTAP